LIPSAYTPESIRDKIYKILAYYINHIGIKKPPNREADFLEMNYIFTDLSLSFEQDFPDFVQQDFPFDPFFFLPFPVSAIAIPAKSKPAVVNNNNFFIFIFL
jgi:hypothetical protein